ncbi:MAG: hypothetical protein ACI9YT_001765, partial [Halobacteriales archaeon]
MIRVIPGGRKDPARMTTTNDGVGDDEAGEK